MSKGAIRGNYKYHGREAWMPSLPYHFRAVDQRGHKNKYAYSPYDDNIILVSAFHESLQHHLNILNGFEALKQRATTKHIK